MAADKRNAEMTCRYRRQLTAAPTEGHWCAIHGVPAQSCVLDGLARELEAFRALFSRVWGDGDPKAELDVLAREREGI